MTQNSHSLNRIFQGWDTYQVSLVRAIQPLKHDQLVWQPAPHMRSVGQVASHISLGRINWFSLMGAPGSTEIAKQASAYQSIDEIAKIASEIVRWLEASWDLVDATLQAWNVTDLDKTYLQPFQGNTYAVSRQWTIWRVLAHDLHHGGELAVMLGMQGIAIPELGDLGGHLNMPPLANADMPS